MACSEDLWLKFFSLRNFLLLRISYTYTMEYDHIYSPFTPLQVPSYIPNPHATSNKLTMGFSDKSQILTKVEHSGFRDEYSQVILLSSCLWGAVTTDQLFTVGEPLFPTQGGPLHPELLLIEGTMDWWCNIVVECLLCMHKSGEGVGGARGIGNQDTKRRRERRRKQEILHSGQSLENTQIIWNLFCYFLMIRFSF